MFQNLKKWVERSSLTLATLFFTLSTHAQIGIISTVVGTGLGGYSGDHGPATSATIDHPIVIATDAAGNLYVADNVNNAIRKISTTGVITTIAGTGTAGYNGDGIAATSAKLNSPYGVAVDAAGNIYIADAFNQRIRKVNTSGIISTIAGTGTAGFNGDGALATATQFWNPTCVRLDATGNIYIADNQNIRIRKISTSNIVSTITGNGSVGYTGDGGPATAARISYPAGIWVDNLGNILIADGLNHAVRKINPAGTISTIAGNGTTGFTGAGGPATAAIISQPEDVFEDISGNLYFVDAVNNTLHKINTSGIITTIAGNGVAASIGDGGPSRAAELNGPDGVCISTSGNIYIAEAFGNRIRMIATGYLPSFIDGASRSISMCTDAPALSIDSVLSVLDSGSSRTLTWQIVTAPSHGAVIGTYSTSSTGGIVVPSGLTYTPAGSYAGSDLFKISVSDGVNTDTITINVVINPLPYAGIISGIDSVCPGSSVPLSETVPGGIWSYSDRFISYVNTSGVATGIAPGVDTVIYTISNECGVVSALFSFTVLSYESCHTGVNNIGKSEIGNKIFPNPSTGIVTIYIVSDKEDQTTVTVNDVLGKKVGQYKIPTNEETTLNFGIAPSMYFIETVTGQQKWSQIIIISK